MREVSHFLHRGSRTKPAVSGAFLTIFTLPTGVPAFQREGGLPAVRGGNNMTTTSRNVTVGLIVAVGLAGRADSRHRSPSSTLAAAGLTQCRERRLRDRRLEPGAGLESDLHRHAHRDEYGELLESAARGDRSHRDLRRLQRHRTAVHANLRSTTAPPRRVAPSRGDRRGVHGAGRPVPVPTAGAR